MPQAFTGFRHINKFLFLTTGFAEGERHSPGGQVFMGVLRQRILFLPAHNHNGFFAIRHERREHQPVSLLNFDTVGKT